MTTKYSEQDQLVNIYSTKVKQLEAQRDELLAALRENYELVNNSDVRYYISSKLGEAARLHSAINKARAAIAQAEKGGKSNE